MAHHQYPDSIGNDVKQGQHYMLFSSYESTSAIAASTILKSSIAIYIPPNSLSTTIQQNYQELEGGATRAALGGGTKDGVLESVKNVFTESAGANITAILQGQTSKIKQLADFRAAGSGLAQNNHVALTYRGPQGFRDHSFVFQFFPKSGDEALKVRNIIEDFQNGATPRRAGGLEKTNRLLTPYFASPRQWVIKFILGKSSGGGHPTGGESAGENPYLPKIKRSVITSFAVNHDPESVVSFHADGSPVHTTLTMTFKEIEHVISGDTVSEQFNSDAAVLDASENQALRRFRPALAENG